MTWEIKFIQLKKKIVVRLDIKVFKENDLDFHFLFNDL